MSQYNRNLEDLGDAIEAIIDQAVSSRNYQTLNQSIRQAVNAVVDTGSDAVRKAVNEVQKQTRPSVIDERRDEPRTPKEEVRQAIRDARQQYRQTLRSTQNQPNRNIYSSHMGSTQFAPPQSNLPVLYKNPSGKLAGGIVKTVGGGLMTMFGSSGVVTTLALGLVGGNAFLALPGAISAAVLGGGAWLLTNGIRTIKRMSRFDKYVKTLGEKTHVDLTKLARAVGKPQKFVKKELKGMIDDGLFLEGHLDEEETSLITSDDTFVHYLETKRQHAVQKQQEIVQTRLKEEEEQKQKVSAQVQEVLDKGNAFIRQIRACNDAIPGQEMTEKISRMETLVRRIFERAKAHPEVVPDLKKLMDYYLPMTVKLLNAYAEMDAQPIQGETIQNSKKEIEGTLDTLNAAFEKLLDSIFKETALDVSSDITVLQTLLAQEGLTEDEFEKMRKNNG